LSHLSKFIFALINLKNIVLVSIRQHHLLKIKGNAHERIMRQIIEITQVDDLMLHMAFFLLKVIMIARQILLCVVKANLLGSFLRAPKIALEFLGVFLVRNEPNGVYLIVYGCIDSI
jgi:hypothetical protein